MVESQPSKLLVASSNLVSRFSSEPFKKGESMINARVMLAVLSTLLSASTMAAFDYAQFLRELNVPQWVRIEFKDSGLGEKYEFSFHINPCYLRGDFDGDSEADIALLVSDKASEKLGIIVFHYHSRDYFVLGAGEAVGNGGDNFYWMTDWAVKRWEPVEEGVAEGPPPVLLGEAIFVEKAESASAIIYWDGTQYTWYHQGDYI